MFPFSTASREISPSNDPRFLDAYKMRPDQVAKTYLHGAQSVIRDLQPLAPGQDLTQAADSYLKGHVLTIFPRLTPLEAYKRMSVNKTPLS